MIMDSAGSYTTKKLLLPESITILPLPPYSPQLNPVKHIWDYTKEQKELNNHSFNSLNDVEIHLETALHDLHNEKSIIKSMCNFKWIKSHTC